MMAASLVVEQATMYCQVPVLGSNEAWIIGCMSDGDFNALAKFCQSGRQQRLKLTSSNE
jgi:hypothetical protein